MKAERAPMANPEEEPLVIIESPEEGEEKKEPPFDYEAAMNNTDFVDFLADCPEASSSDVFWNNESEVERRWQDYEKRQMAKTEFPKFYKEELEPAFGLKLEKGDFADVEAYFDKAAIEDPERVGTYLKDLEAYRKNKATKAKLEGDIARFGGEEKIAEEARKLEEKEMSLKKERSVAEWSIGLKGVINPKNWSWLVPGAGMVGAIFRRFESKEKKDIRTGVRKMGKQERLTFFAALEKRMADTKRSKDFLDRYSEEKEVSEAVLFKIKKEFFENFEPAQKVFDSIYNSAMGRIEQAISFTEAPPKENTKEAVLKALDNTQDYFDKLRKAKQDFDIEKFRDIPTEGDAQMMIDQRLENAVGFIVGGIVDNFHIENKPLEEMRKSLLRFLKREKVGSKSRLATKQFLVSTLRGEVAKLLEMDSKPEDYRQKIVILKTLAAEVARDIVGKEVAEEELE